VTTPDRSLAQRVLRDGTVYALAGVLSQGIAFLLFPFFAHVFEPRDYGIIDLLGVVMILASLTVALEVAQGLGRHYAELADDAERRVYASTAWLFTLGSYTLLALLALAAAGPLTDLLLGDDVDPSIMRVAIGAIWCYGVGYMVIDLLRWRMRPRQFAFVSVTTTAVVTASSAIYVLALDLGVEGAFLGQLTGFATGGALALWLNRDMLGLRFSAERLRRMLAYSVPLVPASIGVFLNGYADRLAIQSKLSLADVGIYGVGYRLSLIVGLTLIGFQGALLPQVLSRHADPGTPFQLTRIFRLFCALALTVLVLVSTFADELIRLLTPPEYYAADDIVPLVVAAAFFAGMYIFAPGLNIAKRTLPVAAITVLGGLANLGLAFALVVPLGIEGAALSFLVTEMATFAALMWWSQQLYPAPHPWGRLAAGAVLGAVLAAAGWLLPPVDEDLWALPVKLVLAMATVAAFWRLLVGADERAMLRRAVGERASAWRSGRAAAARTGDDRSP
jgi:O-antigen/teichoic acid export membrane protein